MKGRTKRARRAACALALVLAAALTPITAFPIVASPHDARTYVSVAIDTTAVGKSIPNDYLGLSFELSSLGELTRLGERGDLVALLRSLGPGVLRLGGVSADTQVGWADAATPRPAWAASTIGPADLERLARLAARSGWRVLLTVGLAHYEPNAAVREVEMARATLGPWLAGIELGNEPNAYARHDLRTAPWTFAQYSAQASSILGAVAGDGGPRPPLAGPDVSGSPAIVRWGPGESALGATLLTGHHYPLGCHAAIRPSIARLLSPAIRRAERISTRRYMSAASRAGIPFRLDEAGSVSCGGRPGISNTFAAALWAADYVARTMAAGMSGINFHGNVRNCEGYSPLCAASAADLAAGRLTAQPEWYALLLDKSLLGDVPLPSSLTWERHANIDVVATRASNGDIHVLIVDDDPPGSRAVAIRLHAPVRFRGAQVFELRAPSRRATSGVSLGGSTVTASGTWSIDDAPRLRADRLGQVTVLVPPSSADLVTLAPAEATQPTRKGASRAVPRKHAGRG